MRFFRKAFGGVPSPVRRPRLFLEELESRLVPASITGNAWPNPQLITLSFVPDGTLISSGTGGSYTSDLFAKLNSHRGWTTQTWENAHHFGGPGVGAVRQHQFHRRQRQRHTPPARAPTSRATRAWATSASAATSSRRGYLGMGYQPPPANNYSIAGDISLNDQGNYNTGTTYDIQTVAMHEIGHALGLDHTTVAGTVMWPYYNGTHTTLSSDDIGGIQAIYGARAPDVYNQGGASDSSFATAANITPLLDPSALTGQATSLDITSPGASEYYTLTAPAGSGPLQSECAEQRPEPSAAGGDGVRRRPDDRAGVCVRRRLLQRRHPHGDGPQCQRRSAVLYQGFRGRQNRIRDGRICPVAQSESRTPGHRPPGRRAAFRNAAEHAGARRRRSPGRGRPGVPGRAA